MRDASARQHPVVVPKCHRKCNKATPKCYACVDVCDCEEAEIHHSVDSIDKTPQLRCLLQIQSTLVKQRRPRGRFDSPTARAVTKHASGYPHSKWGISASFDN
mmetsp:Transcript_27697/g.65042  ORF Transcript_27697/g.65042 Transcript_27697/m.65042 type:complete len:103 (+) Transcript_27697:2137-2445(+)